MILRHLVLAVQYRDRRLHVQHNFNSGNMRHGCGYYSCGSRCFPRAAGLPYGRISGQWGKRSRRTGEGGIKKCGNSHSAHENHGEPFSGRYQEGRDRLWPSCGSRDSAGIGACGEGTDGKGHVCRRTESGRGSERNTGSTAYGEGSQGERNETLHCAMGKWEWGGIDLRDRSDRRVFPRGSHRTAAGGNNRKPQAAGGSENTGGKKGRERSVGDAAGWWQERAERAGLRRCKGTGRCQAGSGDSSGRIS